MERIAYAILLGAGIVWLGVIVFGFVSILPFGLIGLVLLFALGLLLAKALGDRLKNKEDDYYSKHVDK
ncbi:MAG: hypothetical protein GXP31_10495 [Kiritimatiellaeota bacterium]|nr:hypothetical protein [Kiritimatiellota bacterium]